MPFADYTDSSLPDFARRSEIRMLSPGMADCTRDATWRNRWGGSLWRRSSHVPAACWG